MFITFRLGGDGVLRMAYVAKADKGSSFGGGFGRLR